MGKVIKDLLLAMLNATLILVALCLFLGLTVVNRANDLTASFAQNLQIVDPLTQELQETRSEVAALRSDLATLRSQTGELSTATLQNVETRVEALESRVDDVLTGAENIISDPSDIIDAAIQSSADELVESLGELRGCTPAIDAALLDLPQTG